MVVVGTVDVEKVGELLGDEGPVLICEFAALAGGFEGFEEYREGGRRVLRMGEKADEAAERPGALLMGAIAEEDLRFLDVGESLVDLEGWTRGGSWVEGAGWVEAEGGVKRKRENKTRRPGGRRKKGEGAVGRDRRRA